MLRRPRPDATEPNFNLHATDRAPHPHKLWRLVFTMPRPEKSPAIDILASRRNGTLYFGATSDLIDRISIHKQDLAAGFTQRYGVHLLVHHEHFDTMDIAIRR